MQHRLCQCSDAQVQVKAGGGARPCWLPCGPATWRDPGGAGEGTGADEQRRPRGHAQGTRRRPVGLAVGSLHSAVLQAKPSIITSSRSTLPSPLQRPVRVAPGSWGARWVCACTRRLCRVTVDLDRSRPVDIRYDRIMLNPFPTLFPYRGIGSGTPPASAPEAPGHRS